MQAIRIHTHGGLDALSIDTLPIPTIRNDEVLIRIKAAALNHLDLWVRKGIPGVPLPLIMGSDGAGVIEKIGETAEKVSGWKSGDEVIMAPIRSCGKCAACLNEQENLCMHFQIPGEQVDGTQAEYIVVPAQYVFNKPKQLSWEEAAALPLASLTANHMLTRKVQIKSGDWILVWGASSGVGSAAIQIAKSFGARVITTVGSDDKKQLAEKLGADFIINYNDQPVGKAVKDLTNGNGVDVVIEHSGEKTWPDSLRALKLGGKIVTCGATTGSKVQIDLRALFIKHQQIIGSTMGTRQDLAEVIKLVEHGNFKPIVGRVFPFREIKAAHEWLEQGRQSGKVVISFASCNS